MDNLERPKNRVGFVLHAFRENNFILRKEDKEIKKQIKDHKIDRAYCT